MKKTVLLFMAMFLLLGTSSVMATQITKDTTESVSPSIGVTVYRSCAYATIEKDEYENVEIEITAADFRDKWEGVKIIVTSLDTGEKIYSRHFSKSYLYGFSDKSIVVGKGNILTQVTIWKSSLTGHWLAEIKEKGIY